MDEVYTTLVFWVESILDFDSIFHIGNISFESNQNLIHK